MAKDNTKVEHHILKPAHLKEALVHCIQAQVPAMIWGEPGGGKTQIVGQVAHDLFGSKGSSKADYGLDTEFFRKYILSQREPVDAIGLPVPEHETGVVRWFRPEDIPVDGAGVFFLDELPQAVPTLQAPGRQVLTERAFGPHRLGDGWAVIAAGNYPSNRAGSHKLLTHVGSSVVHLHMRPDLEDFCRIAASRGMRAEVIAWLRFRGESALMDFNTDTDTFPCPRQWEKISRLMDTEPSSYIEHALYAGAVGEGMAAEFVGFLRVFKALPDIDQIIKHPTKAPVPKDDDMGTMYALTAALGRRADKDNVENILTYLDRLPIEYNVFAVRDATRRDKSLTKVKAVTEWALQHQHVVIG